MNPSFDTYTFLCDKCHRAVHITTSNRNAHVRAECCGRILNDLTGRIYQTGHNSTRMRMIGSKPIPDIGKKLEP